MVQAKFSRKFNFNNIPQEKNKFTTRFAMSAGVSLCLIWILYGYRCCSIKKRTLAAITCVVFIATALIVHSTASIKSFIIDIEIAERLSCHVPVIDPFDKSILPFYTKTGPIACKEGKYFTKQNGNVLSIDENMKPPTLDYCEYNPIIRPNDNSDNQYKFEDVKYKFRKDVTVEHEFIRVKCFDKLKREIYQNFHAFALRRTSLEREKEVIFNKHFHKSIGKHSLNVVLLGVDSVSKLNFDRHMPRTKKFLMTSLQAVELETYNKVADNTFVNIVPLTIGKYVEELPWNKTMSSKPLDKYDFIWKKYSNSGYITLFAEDAPGMATFNYLKSGFHKQPCDHYLRPFALAMKDAGDLWDGPHCFGGRLETKLTLDYLNDFMTLYKQKPHFALTFISRLTHDYVNYVGHVDETYEAFFEKVHNERLMNNTVLFYFSDHGMRFGEIRNTYVGKLEERLPFMYVVVPNWLHKTYPNVVKHLRINAQRLTTPFDIHQTLLNILSFEGEPEEKTNQRAYSLFQKIPANRTCAEASILPHWCTCSSRKQMSLDDERVIKAANTIVNNINALLEGSMHLCAELKVGEILEASQLIAYDTLLTFKQSLYDVINRTVYYENRTVPKVDIQLSIATSPGDAIFEATVRHSENMDDYSVEGDMSRTTRYGNQSHCIEKPTLKKYCFCKSLIARNNT